ncbi:MAG: BTAD domain-containing putative transcriptional regulator [Burkholderiales bacterium]|nr:BTAD domain-containing putative transcriptional regulator [Burkholderiales bacterium]
MPAVRIPKVQPPRLGNVSRRPRVTALLQAAERRGATWIHATGGSGKTTAVADAALASGRKLAWLHLDEGDAEPATFFHFLSLAVAPILKKRGEVLPLFAPELARDLPLFARRFARALLSHDAEAALVLDNLQDVGGETPVHAALAALLEEMAGAWSLQVISRQPPGEAYARLLGQGRLSLVPPDRVAFTEEEFYAAFRLRGVADDARLKHLWERSEGWIAGALLLATQDNQNQASEGAGKAVPVAVAGQEILFNYFASQAFGSLHEADRKLLVDTSFLRAINAEDAAVLCGVEDAAERLRRLAREGQFVVAQGDSGGYRVHDLYRAFLQAQAERSLDATSLSELKLASARHARERGDLLDSVELLVSARAWPLLQSMLVEDAETLVNRGYVSRLADLLASAPPEALNAHPWLAYFCGQGWLSRDVEKANVWIRNAHAGFVAAGDRAGQLVSAVDARYSSFYQFKSAEEHRTWTALIEPLLDVEEFPTAYFALKVSAGLLGAIYMGSAIESHVDRLVARIYRELPHIEDPGVKLQALTQIATVAFRCYRLDLMQPAVNRVEADGLDTLASPQLRLNWYYDNINFEMMHGSVPRALQLSALALALATESALPQARLLSLAMRLDALCDRRDVVAAKPLLAELDRVIDPARPFTQLIPLVFRAKFGAVEGRLDEARTAAREAVALADKIGVQRDSRLVYFMLEVGIECLDSQWHVARELVARYRGDFIREPQAIIDLYSLWIDAAEAVEAERADARALLAQAIAGARALNFYHVLRNAQALSARLCAKALEWRIDPPYVRELIARRGLDAPDALQSQWPWPIRVTTLGSFSLTLKGQPAEAGRTQAKVMQLLQVLIARGGDAVPVDDIITALWPGEGRQGTQQVFDTTLHRLRKLLDSDTAIHLADRALTLNRKEIWVDSVALEARLDGLAGKSAESSAEALGGLVADYPGHFLATAGDAAWALPLRDRIWRKLTRLLDRQVRHEMAEGRWEDAADILHFVSDRDGAAESAHLALIEHYERAGRIAEAVQLCERSEQRLLTEFGLLPSEALRAAAARLRQRRAAGV